MNNRPLINVLVYSPKGVLFFKVIDALGHKKNSEYIFKILHEAILEVGEKMWFKSSQTVPQIVWGQGK